MRVTPKAGRDAVAGVVRDAAGTCWLAVKVSSPPEDGRANDATIRLLARCCAVAPSAIRLAAGAGSRWKRLVIAGDAEDLGRRLAAVAKEPA